MAHPPPSSFGRPGENATLQPIAVNMPDRLPAVSLPVVVEVDPASMRRFSEELTAVVTAAVRAGYATAVEDIEFEAEDAGDYENPSAELRETLNEFIRDNHELLERLGRQSGGPAVANPPPGGCQ